MVATALKVAFATSDGKLVNQHFGSAQGFAMYAVTIEQSTLLEVAEFEAQAQDGNENKLGAKLALLEGCAAVYSQAIGASAIQQLLARNIQPVKVSEASEIAELLVALQQELRAGPSTWLAKAIQRQHGWDKRKFDDMEAEGWRE
ncbi:MAG: NifB/NifX family molybdenum-iron cluster-binding protein [Thiotrichaceae bacterium]